MNSNEIETKDINTTALAYMGDAVYEIYVRKHVISGGHYNVDMLHKSAVKYVKAASQANALKRMMAEDEKGNAFLTEEERALAKRARNHKIASKAKNADPVDYKNATAFEALLGHLYLSGQKARLEEVILKAMEITEEQ